MTRMFAWIKANKRIVAAVGAAVAAFAAGMGYACPEPIVRAWAALMGVL